jgi:hypothetical protein
MYVPENFTEEGDTYFSPAIWDYNGLLQTGESYALLASAPLILDNTNEQFSAYATLAVFNSGKRLTSDSQSDAYTFFAFRPYNLQSLKKVDIGATQFATTAGYATELSIKYPHTTFTSGGEIIRFNDPAVTDQLGQPITLEQTLATGALSAKDEKGAPANFFPVY